MLKPFLKKKEEGAVEEEEEEDEEEPIISLTKLKEKLESIPERKEESEPEIITDAFGFNKSRKLLKKRKKKTLSINILLLIFCPAKRV